MRRPCRAWNTTARSARLRTWVGRAILDGRAIADEYRMTGPDGELLVLGVNLRAYDAARQRWPM